MPKKLFSEFDFDSIQFSDTLKKQDSKPEKKEPSLSEQVELAKKYCMIDEFGKANEICASMLEKDPFFVPAYACLVRIESQNYTVYTGEKLDKYLRFLKRLDKEKEYWNELNAFLKEREDFLNPKPVKEAKEEAVVSNHAEITSKKKVVRKKEESAKAISKEKPSSLKEPSTITIKPSYSGMTKYLSLTEAFQRFDQNDYSEDVIRSLEHYSEQNVKEASFILAFFYSGLKNTSIPADYRKAKFYALKIASESKEASWILYRIYTAEGDVCSANKYLLQAGELGDDGCLYDYIMNLYYGKNGLSKDVKQAIELAKRGFERKMVKSSFAWGWIIFSEAIKTNDNSKITDCAYMFEQYGLYLLKSKDGICDDYLEIILEYFMYCYRQASFQCFGYLSNDWLKIFKVAIERNMMEAYYLVGIDIVTHSDSKTIQQGLDYLDRASYSIKEACEFLTPKYLYGYSEIPADIEKAKKYAIQGYQLKSFKCAEHLAFMYCTGKISNGEDKSMMYGLILYHYYDCTHDEDCVKLINEDIKADFRQGKALKKLRDMSQSERQKYYREYIDFRIPE